MCICLDRRLALRQTSFLVTENKENRLVLHQMGIGKITIYGLDYCGHLYRNADGLSRGPLMSLTTGSDCKQPEPLA